MATKREELEAQYKALDEQYDQAVEPIHSAIADEIAGKGAFSDGAKPYDTQNVRRFDRKLSHTAYEASDILASGMAGWLVSRARKWFRLTHPDKDVRAFYKEWFTDAEELLMRAFAQSNFYPAQKTIFEDQGNFGTAGAIIEAHPQNLIHIGVLEPGTFRIARDQYDEPESLYRSVWWTAKQIEDRFGKAKMSSASRSAIANNRPFEYFEIMHCIKKRPKRNFAKMGGMDMPWMSVWWEKTGNSGEILFEGGFEEQAFILPRWKPHGSLPWGIGPGYLSVGIMRYIEELEITGIKARHRQADPPLDIPSEFEGVLSLLPGAENYRSSTDRGKVESIYNINFDYQAMRSDIMTAQEYIRSLYYNPLFLMLQQTNTPPTATQILEQKEEQMILLSPTVERQEGENHGDIINRTLAIAARNQMLGEIPPEVIGVPLKVEQISVLGQAARQVDAVKLRAYLDEQGRVAQLSPEEILNTDYAEYLDKFADITGVPAGILRDKREVDKLKALQQQVAQQQQQLEQMSQMAVAAKDLGQANTEGTALGAITGQQ